MCIGLKVKHFIQVIVAILCNIDVPFPVYMYFMLLKRVTWYIII